MSNKHLSAKISPLSSPIYPSSSWITDNVDWHSIKPLSAGDPCDGAIGVVDDGGGDGLEGWLHLHVINCDLVRMSIC